MTIKEVHFVRAGDSALVYHRSKGSKKVCRRAYLQQVLSKPRTGSGQTLQHVGL
jgi:hypothetical protein